MITQLTRVGTYAGMKVSCGMEYVLLRLATTSSRRAVVAGDDIDDDGEAAGFGGGGRTPVPSVFVLLRNTVKAPWLLWSDRWMMGETEGPAVDSGAISGGGDTGCEGRGGRGAGAFPA